jgi:hypothetical protein
MPAGEVEDHVVALPAAGEVLPGVVDDVVGAEGADQLDVAGAAHAGHVGAEGLGDLHGEGANTSRRAVDQHGLAGLHLADVAQTLKGGDGGERHCGGLLEGEVGGLGCEQTLGNTRVLGEAAGGGLGVDLVTRTEPGDGATDRHNRAGEVASADRDAWPTKPECHTQDGGPTGGDEPVRTVDRGGMDSDEHVVGSGTGPVMSWSSRTSVVP